MATRAIEILSDREHHRRMGVAARRVAIERFDEARIVPRYREVYERVIAGERVGV